MIIEEQHLKLVAKAFQLKDAVYALADAGKDVSAAVQNMLDARARGDEYELAELDTDLNLSQREIDDARDA